MSKIIKKRFRGTTLVEILDVMIISGIVFLLLFDGLNIINQYSHVVNRKINQKLGLLYGHQNLELILEQTDSIQMENVQLLLYGTNKLSFLTIDSTAIVLLDEDRNADTLFNNITDVHIHSLTDNKSLVDSIYLSVAINNDTIQLKYGLPINIARTLIHP